VKLGYNPNSSSMGSVVFGIPLVLLVGGVLLGVGTAGLGALLVRADTTQEPGEQPAPPPSEPAEHGDPPSQVPEA